MAVLARKIFAFVLLSQIAILLAYILMRNFPTDVFRRHSVDSPGPHIATQNRTRDDNHFVIQRQNSPKIADVSPKSHEAQLSSTRRHTVQQITNTPNTAAGSGGAIKGTTVENLPVLTSTTAWHKTIERKPFNETKTDNVFQQIDDKKAWLYSAFFDYVAEQQKRPSVRIFGIIQRELLQDIFCNVSIDQGNVVVSGSVSEFPDSHGVSFPPVSLDCRLPANIRPTHVSISFQKNLTATNRLQIIYPGTLTRNFTVCYSVLHSGYRSASQLIQSLEMNRILGAEHFMVYNNSISPDVDQILRRYQQDGLVTVLPWPVPTQQSWYFGQMSAINDCFYRNRNISRFVVVIDTDELLMPKNHSNWMEMINALSPQENDVSKFIASPNPTTGANSKTGCFLVRSSYFSTSSKTNWTSLPSQFPFSDTEKNNTIKYNILILSQFLRSSEIYRAKVKSKFIARPELTYTSGIHFVHTFTYNMRCQVAPESIALVHHYRKPTMQNGQMDTTVLKFKNQLYLRVMEKLKLFPNIFIF